MDRTWEPFLCRATSLAGEVETLLLAAAGKQPDPSSDTARVPSGRKADVVESMYRYFRYSVLWAPALLLVRTFCC